MELCIPAAPVASLLFFCETSPVPRLFAECPGGGGEAQSWADDTHASHSRIGSSPYSGEEAPDGLRGSGVPSRGPAAGGRDAEEKGRGGGASSSRQREQQIAPSQWEPQAEVAPNSLRPMTRRSLQKPISISPGAGAAVCLRHPACARPAPRTPGLCLLPSPPMRGSRGEPTLRTLPRLAANKRGSEEIRATGSRRQR